MPLYAVHPKAFCCVHYPRYGPVRFNSIAFYCLCLFIYVELVLRIDHWRDLRQGCAVVEYSLFPKQLDDY